MTSQPARRARPDALEPRNTNHGIFGIDWVGINAENGRKLLLSLLFIAAVLLVSVEKVITSIAGDFVVLRGSTFTAADRISMGGVR